MKRSTDTDEALWIGRQGTFTMAHTDGDAGVGVVLCSPFGWEDVASYPARRAWAAALHAEGFSTARFDWPGAGDSAGSAREPGRLGAWCAALHDVAAWLRLEAGVTRIAAIGIGFGGLIAVETIRRGTQIDDLVLWGCPQDGPSFIRAEFTFSRLQDDRLLAEEGVLPDGGIESSGYVLSADTVRELRSVRGWLEAPGSLERVLLLPRDDASLPPGQLARWMELGVELQIADGPGYGAMVKAPHLAAAPQQTCEQVRTWLAASPRTAARCRPPVAVAGQLELDLGCARERTIRVEASRGGSFATITEPHRREPAAPVVVFLPAWGERRSGPSRLWTEAARRAAALGVPALRVDLPGIGDATGRSTWLSAPLNVNHPEVIAEIRGVLDAAQAQNVGERFLLVGLCSGATWALRGLLADERVSGAVALNFPHISLFPLQDRQMVVRKLGRVLRPRTWWRVLRGELRMSSALASGMLLLRARRSADAGGGGLQAMLEPVADRNAPVTFAFSQDEPLRRCFLAPELASWLRARPLIRVVELPSIDHDLRSLPAQSLVHDLIVELIATATASAAALREPLASGYGMPVAHPALRPAADPL